MTLIGLCGPKGVGKSTLATRLEGRGYERLSFAGPLKAALTAMFAGTATPDFATMDTAAKETPLPGLGVTPRRLMQTLGDEWGRRLIHPEIWIDLMRARLVELARPPFTGPLAEVVIDDVRYDNEAELIREMGGVVLKVNRSNFQTATDAHRSEQGINPDLIHGEIYLAPPPAVPFSLDILEAYVKSLR